MNFEINESTVAQMLDTISGNDFLLEALKSDRGGFKHAALRSVGIEVNFNPGWFERAIGKKVLKSDYEKALSLRNKKSHKIN